MDGGGAVIEALWAHIEARNWSALRGLLAEDLVVDWPVTGERLVGPDNFVAVNAEYPEGWSIDVLSIVAAGSRVASEVSVPHRELGMFAVASFWTIDKGCVSRGVEYWTAPGSETRPNWREPYTELPKP